MLIFPGTWNIEKGENMKTLTLKPRMTMGNGEYAWHDYHVLANALTAIARGKSYMQMAMWISAAGKIQSAVEEQVGKSDRLNIPIVVEIRNIEASHLWRELMKLPAEQFGFDMMTHSPQVPPLGTLKLMLQDFAEQLGEKLPESEDEEET
jgi:hypothetical protein